jgi:GNAT superfamily N-acetyltransferase
MNVRHLRDRDDVRAVQRVNRAAWQAAYDDFLPDEVLDRGELSEEDVADYFDRVRDDRDWFLVAEHEGEVVGYAYVRWAETKAFVGRDEAGLKEIYGHPDHWGEGVGSRLLERAVELVPENATALKLEAFAENEVGARFYEARGFERVGSREVEIAGESYESTIWARAL